MSITFGFHLRILNVENEMAKKQILLGKTFHMREILVAYGTGASVRAECPSIFQEN